MMQVNPPQIMADVAVQSRPTAAAITRSRRRASSSRSRLREVAAGRKIGRFQKITGGDPMKNQAQIDQLLRQKSEAKEIPGVVAIAATSKEVIYQGAYGKRDLSKDDAMTADSVFWIASMTKAITAAAAMQLVEQGKLALEAPIGMLLPDLAAPLVLEGFDAQGEPKLRPAKNPITLRHLMTHTAGFAYNMWNGDMVKYLDKTGLPTVTTCKNAALKTPVMSDPGTRWEYGTNIDFVGKAVE